MSSRWEMEDDEKCAMDDDLDLRLSSLNFLSDFRYFEDEETIYLYAFLDQYW